jgi:hypothetical protein
MRLNTWSYRLLVLIIVAISYNYSLAHDNSKLAKTISKRYPVAPGSSLGLNNKYGDVIVKSWDKDSMAITVSITAFGKDDQAAERLLDRTEIQFMLVGSGVQVSTQLSKSDGWMRDFWNELSGYSQTIISKDQLTINYQVYIPEDLDLEVYNKYGNVFLDDRLGTTRIDVSNGNFKAEELLGENYLSFKFGNADISKLVNGDVLLKSAELNLGQASTLNVQSNSSTILIDQVGKIKFTSRTDKITIRNSKEIAGQTSFSKVQIRELTGSLDLDTNYGSLELESIDPGFSEILVHGNSTDVDLRFDNMAHFNTRIVAKEGKFELPADHGLKQVYTDGTEKFVKSSGSLGRPKSNPGEVNIDAQGGKVQVHFVPFDAHSSK